MVEGRTFLRGIVSDTYGLREYFESRRDAARVRGSEFLTGDREVNASRPHGGSVRWRVGPGDEPFLTQTLQVHFNELPPKGSNAGHGHQNEAAFYVLEGEGHEIHDGERHDWRQGDLIAVHTDSVHRHFNDSDHPARLLVIKAKAMWMLLGLVQQGRGGEWDDSREFGEREDWSRLWTEGSEQLPKIVREEDTEWAVTRDGNIRIIASAERDVRLFSIDLYEQRIEPGKASARHWHMADEIVYVLDGAGHSLHWEVEAEIADRYYARIARTPSRHSVKAGEVLYVPPNTVHQHFNDLDQPLRVLCAHNRVFSQIGYDRVVYLDAETQ